MAVRCCFPSVRATFADNDLIMNDLGTGVFNDLQAPWNALEVCTFISSEAEALKVQLIIVKQSLQHFMISRSQKSSDCLKSVKMTVITTRIQTNLSFI